MTTSYIVTFYNRARENQMITSFSLPGQDHETVEFWVSQAKKILQSRGYAVETKIEKVTKYVRNWIRYGDAVEQIIALLRKP